MEERIGFVILSLAVLFGGILAAEIYDALKTRWRALGDDGPPSTPGSFQVGGSSFQLGSGGLRQRHFRRAELKARGHVGLDVDWKSEE